MRRLFVIFLALLFPLNVLALSMSVSAQATGAPERVVAVAYADAALQGDTPVEVMCDIDPDEPPAGTDFHDSVHAAARPLFAAPPDTSVSSFVPPRRGRDPLPPIKPPPVA